MSAYETLKDLRDRVVGQGPWRAVEGYHTEVCVKGSIGTVSLFSYPELVELIPDLLDEYDDLSSKCSGADWDAGYSEGRKGIHILERENLELEEEISELEAEIKDLKRYIAEEMRLAGKREIV